MLKKINKTKELKRQYIQVKITDAILETKDFFPIKYNPNFPYNSTSILLIILSQTLSKINYDYLSGIMMKLQYEYCFPFDYLFINGETADLGEDLSLLKELGLVAEDLSNNFFLTSKGEKAANIIKTNIETNLLENFTKYPTLESISNVISEFLEVSMSKIKEVNKNHWLKYKNIVK
ncbi:hypothetical protein [Candidatus Pyrohabitans sp.]